MCTFKYFEEGKKGDYFTPDDEEGYKCSLSGDWVEHTCHKCPLPCSCVHWKERNLLTDKLDICEYHANEYGLEMTSLCSTEHCPVSEEKEWAYV